LYRFGGLFLYLVEVYNVWIAGFIIYDSELLPAYIALEVSYW